MQNLEHNTKIRDHVRHIVRILVLFVDYVMSQFTSFHKEDSIERIHDY